jgi:hypothetical protein
MYTNMHKIKILKLISSIPIMFATPRRCSMVPVRCACQEPNRGAGVSHLPICTNGKKNIDFSSPHVIMN